MEEIFKDEKIRDLESNCDKQKDNQKVLQQKCDNLDIQLNQQNGTVKQLRNELESAKNLNASEKIAVKNLESSIDKLKKEKNEVVNNLESTEAKLAKQVDANNQLEKDKEDLQENVERLTGYYYFFTVFKTSCYALRELLWTLMVSGG